MFNYGMKKQDTLAWYCYPEPDGKSYFQGDLQNLDVVRELFDYCQLNYASISAVGWQYLIEYHGIKTLLKINHASGWFEAETESEIVESLLYESRVAGYDPETNCFGNLSENEQEFIPSKT